MSVTGELLAAAKGLLAKGKSEGASARTSDGTPCDPFDEDAASFSIYGALQRAAYERKNTTGVDAALLLLGVNDLQDARMDGVTKALSDEDIAKRFDDAIARADGGPIKERSFDAEKRMLNPNDPDYAEQVRALLSNGQATVEPKPVQKTKSSEETDPQEK
jgi:hypothetical protein